MNIRAIKTHKITSVDKDLFAILDKYLPKLSEQSIVAVTSKIISIIEGRVVLIKKTSDEEILKQVQDDTEEKDRLIEQEAQFYLPRENNKWNVGLTIARNNLVASAGIDESNGNGYYILWPSDPQKVANDVRRYVKEVRGVREVGVIITDSKTTPLRWGTTGFALAHSGFAAIRDYIGKPDVFGRKLVYTKLNIADSLASSAVLAMGEGKEQTPLAVIEDVSDIEFQDRSPSQKELAELQITPDDDLYAALLKTVKWRKGKA